MKCKIVECLFALQIAERRITFKCRNLDLLFSRTDESTPDILIAVGLMDSSKKFITCIEFTYRFVDLADEKRSNHKKLIFFRQLSSLIKGYKFLVRNHLKLYVHVHHVKKKKNEKLKINPKLIFGFNFLIMEFLVYNNKKGQSKNDA